MGTWSFTKTMRRYRSFEAPAAMPVGAGGIVVRTLTALMLLGVAFGCSMDDNQAAAVPPSEQDSLYAFSDPDATFELPPELEEISGLTLMEDGMLGAIQDEDGDLFIIDPATGQVLDVRPFGERGDYEGIARAEDRLYILRSDGRVFSFSSWTGSDLAGDSYDYDLPAGCDAEGIVHQSSLNRMLIACKENAGDGRQGTKAIFAFDPTTRQLEPEPAYTIDLKKLERYIEDHPINKALRNVLSERLELTGFKPSALAVHPLTGDLYVASSVRKVIVQIGEDGAIIAVWQLPGELFAQPEGIAFDTNGDLYVSSEAGNRRTAMLYMFRYRGGSAESASMEVSE